MIATHTVQLRGYTSKAGYKQLEAVLELLRHLYNGALEDRRTAGGRETVWYTDSDTGDLYRRTEQRRQPEWRTLAQQSLQLKHIRADNPDYAALDNHLLNSTLRRLETSMQAFFRRLKAGEKPGFPRFKGAGRFRTISIDTVSRAWLKYVDDKRAFLVIKGLPRIELKHKGRIPAPVWGKDNGTTKLKVDKETGEIIGGGNSKNVPEPCTWPLSVRITLKGRRLFVSLAYQIEKTPLPDNSNVLGIDMGINRRTAYSDTAYSQPDTPKAQRRRQRRRTEDERRKKRHERKQSKLRRSAVKNGLAEYQFRGGRSRVVWRNGISRAYQKSGAIKRNILHRRGVSDVQATHRLTTDLVRRYGLIAIENLTIRNMSKSAAGTVDEPGKNVAQKRGLNRSILEQQWGELARQLAYKAEWAGRQFDKVKPYYTSQVCHQCGVVGKRNGIRFRCPNSGCGWQGDADDNAAINILVRYLAEQAGMAWPCAVSEVRYRGESIGNGLEFVDLSPCAADIVATPEPPPGGPRHAQESISAEPPAAPRQLRLFDN